MPTKDCISIVVISCLLVIAAVWIFVFANQLIKSKSKSKSKAKSNPDPGGQREGYSTPGYQKHTRKVQRGQHLFPNDDTGKIRDIRDLARAQDLCDETPDCAGFQKNIEQGVYQFKKDMNSMSPHRNFEAYVKSSDSAPGTLGGNVNSSTLPPASVPLPPASVPLPTIVAGYEQHLGKVQREEHLFSDDTTGKIRDIRDLASAEALCDSHHDCAGFHKNKSQGVFQFKKNMNSLDNQSNFDAYVKRSNSEPPRDPQACIQTQKTAAQGAVCRDRHGAIKARNKPEWCCSEYGRNQQYRWIEG
jgi:hypothetical protein